jgi:hypothetical protein
MAIYIGSRYENSVVDFFQYKPLQDPRPTVFYEFGDIGKINYVNYTWKNGDRMDQVAAQFFAYPDRWWIIAQFNPKVTDFFNIPTGTVLRIPRV